MHVKSLPHTHMHMHPPHSSRTHAALYREINIDAAALYEDVRRSDLPSLYLITFLYANT